MIGRLSGPRQAGLRSKYLLPIGIIDFRARSAAASRGALRFFDDATRSPARIGGHIARRIGRCCVNYLAACAGIGMVAVQVLGTSGARSPYPRYPGSPQRRDSPFGDVSTCPRPETFMPDLAVIESDVRSDSRNIVQPMRPGI